MTKDYQDVLEVLKDEGDFLERGGYSCSPHQPWRAQLIFEDSPTCMNYGTKDRPGPCAECLLMQFVPPESRGQKVPCRHIPLTQDRQTLSDLYWVGTQEKIEDALGSWLRSTIARVEGERAELGGYFW